MRHIGGNLTV